MYINNTFTCILIYLYMYINNTCQIHIMLVVCHTQLTINYPAILNLRIHNRRG